MELITLMGGNKKFTVLLIVVHLTVYSTYGTLWHKEVATLQIRDTFGAGAFGGVVGTCGTKGQPCDSKTQTGCCSGFKCLLGTCSCAANGETCNINGQVCCGGLECKDKRCTSSCAGRGQSCAGGKACCPFLACQAGKCRAVAIA